MYIFYEPEPKPEPEPDPYQWYNDILSEVRTLFEYVNQWPFLTWAVAQLQEVF